MTLNEVIDYINTAINRCAKNISRIKNGKDREIFETTLNHLYNTGVIESYYINYDNMIMIFDYDQNSYRTTLPIIKKDVKKL